jgi:hypothetical protein
MNHEEEVTRMSELPKAAAAAQEAKESENIR